MGFPSGPVVKKLPADAGDAGDVGSISGLGRSPREGNGWPLECPQAHGQRGLVGYGLGGGSQSRTRLSD